MGIVTKCGDDGTTCVYGNKRVSKHSPQIELCGLLDELLVYLGYASFMLAPSDKKCIKDISTQLYYLVSSVGGSVRFASHSFSPGPLEEEISEKEQHLPRLSRFVIMDASQKSLRIHMARCVCRNVERRMVAYCVKRQMHYYVVKKALPYLNRLSDYLFVLARWYNTKKEKLYIP